MDILSPLRARGLVHDCSDEKAMLNLKPQDGFYVGFDPTAPSLQLGNLVPLVVTIHLAKAGLTPVLLFGGATGAIGDPSGKSAERQLLERATIESNIANHQRTVSGIFERLKIKPHFVNNYDWTKDISVLEFLRDVGKHFTVNYMVAKEVVKTRLGGEGISFTEFSYMLLQANDFLHLHQHHNCKLQIGGSDQWGNITAGLELIRRKIQGEAVAFSIPLLTDSQGKKFGKSEGGTLWLDPSATSPYRFHQFWLNVADADVGRYLRVFTFFEEDEIQALEKATKEAPEKRAAQNALADSVCSLVHGESATRDARRCAEVLFGGSLDGLSSQQLEEIFQDSPSSTLLRSQILKSSFAEILTTSGLVKSKGEAKRLIQNGGAYLNNQRVNDVDFQVSDDATLASGVLVLRSGKKQYHLVKVTND